jgi:creatinine amidohydrolase
MAEMTVKDVIAALKKTKTAILPLAVVEQHGYHLPLSTDIYNATEVSRRVSEKTGAVVAPVLPYSFSGGELPGTINVRPQVMSLMVSDILGELARIGFRNLVVLLGHGGTENLAALKDALRQFTSRTSHVKGLVVSLIPFWEFSPTMMDLFRKGDFHASRGETSLMRYWAPELVRKKIVTDRRSLIEKMMKDPDAYQKKEKILDSPYIIPKTPQRKEIKVGVMGFTDGISADLGKTICDEAVRGICKHIKQIEQKMKR